MVVRLRCSASAVDRAPSRYLSTLSSPRTKPPDVDALPPSRASTYNPPIDGMIANARRLAVDNDQWNAVGPHWLAIGA
jgi:hypothetical protein